MTRGENMKNIYLIDDSIRFGAPGSPGYGVYVKEKLESRAKVYAPEENCRFAQYLVAFVLISLGIILGNKTEKGGERL